MKIRNKYKENFGKKNYACQRKRIQEQMITTPDQWYKRHILHINDQTHGQIYKE